MEEHKQTPEKSGEWKNRLKKSVGNFIYQLAIVVLGILITFVGSDVIGNMSNQKQLRQSMKMVVNELVENLRILENIRLTATTEARVAGYFSERLTDFSAIPTDTLERYQDIFLSSPMFNLQKNAMETFKVSGIVQDESSQELLNEIFNCYDNIETIQKTMDQYYYSKTERMETFAAKMTIPQVLQIREGNALYFWSLFMQDDKMRNLSLNTGNTTQIMQACSATEENIAATIEMIRKKYKLNKQTQR